mgnify:CR=1 FL=1
MNTPHPFPDALRLAAERSMQACDAERLPTAEKEVLRRRAEFLLQLTRELAQAQKRGAE